jgi:ParB-like chromosome segregation protein Spo0J
MMIKKQGKYGIETIESFKDSIRTNTPILPVVAWRERGGNFSLISGRHRVLAALEMGLEYIPVIKMYWRDKWED